jgi:hypothetical protein
MSLKKQIADLKDEAPRAIEQTAEEDQACRQMIMDLSLGKWKPKAGPPLPDSPGRSEILEMVNRVAARLPKKET